MLGSPDTQRIVPLRTELQMKKLREGLPEGRRKGVDMKLVRRVVIALGSIAALVLAGGAHFKVA